MTANIKTLDDYGFLLCFIGGILVVVMAILGLVVYLIGTNINWFLGGGGYIGIANEIAGAIVAIVFGVFAILIGMKLFSVKFWNILVKIDLIITAIVMIVIGIIAFGIGGILILVGGILVLVYRLTPEGAANPTGE